MDPVALARWTGVLNKVAEEVEWIASEHKIGSILRIFIAERHGGFRVGPGQALRTLVRQLGLDIRLADISAG